MDWYWMLYLQRIDYAPGTGALVHYGPKSEFADAGHLQSLVSGGLKDVSPKVSLH